MRLLCHKGVGTGCAPRIHLGPIACKTCLCATPSTQVPWTHIVSCEVRQSRITCFYTDDQRLEPLEQDSTLVCYEVVLDEKVAKSVVWHTTRVVAKMLLCVCVCVLGERERGLHNC